MPQRLLLETSLRAILDSRGFRNSKRFPALLEYAVRYSLDKNFQKLKERTIGIDVFGRPIDYDPGTDPVVRVAFGEMRKRLVIFYSEFPDTPIRIDFPVGGYTAEFSFHDEHGIDAEPHLPALAPPLPEPGDEIATLSARSRNANFIPRLLIRLRWPWVALAVALFLAAAMLGYWRHLQYEHQLDFWRPLLISNDLPPIVLGEGPSFDLKGHYSGSSIASESDTQQLLRQPKSLPMKLGNAQASAQICGIFRTYGQPCQITSANLASFNDLRSHNAVLVGGINNFWSIRALEPLRFAFAFDTPNSPATAHRLSIVDRDNPNSIAAWSIPANSDTKPEKDYAIIARFHSELTDGTLVVLGGLGPTGTAGAGEFLAAPQNMRQILAQAPKDWKGLNLEIVLQTDSVRYYHGHTTVLATYFW